MMMLTCKLQPLAAAVLCLAVSGPGQLARAEEPAPRQNEAKFEVRFMQNMIDHHLMAVMMSSLCEERAVHDDLLSLCDEIILTQSSEIELMQSWLREWYGVTYEPVMTRKMERQIAELAELDGETFEIAFMEMMVKHHAQAVKEGHRCTHMAYHRKLIRLCEDIVSTQLEEIELMQSWLCQWYDRCR